MIVHAVSMAKTREEKEYWPWPYFKIQVTAPDYNTKVYFKFAGAVSTVSASEVMQIDIILLGKYGSQPSSLASSALSGMDTLGRKQLSTIRESLPQVRGRLL